MNDVDIVKSLEIVSEFAVRNTRVMDMVSKMLVKHEKEINVLKVENRNLKLALEVIISDVEKDDVVENVGYIS